MEQVSEREKRIHRTTNIIRAVSIIIAVISVIVSLYIHRTKENQRDFFETALTQRAMELYNSATKISEHRTTIRGYEELIKVYQDSIYTKSVLLDSLEKNRDDVRILILNLKEKLNEGVIILDVDSDEQFRIFLEWSKPE